MKKTYKIIGIILILILIFFAFYYYILSKNIQKENTSKAQELYIKNNTFIIDKIISYSNVSIENDENIASPYWKISVNQFTDFAIYIRVNENINVDERKIEKISIENFKIETEPNLGIPKFCSRSLKEFGKTEISKENYSNNIDFEIIHNNDNVDEKKLQFKMNGEIPLTFGYINEGVLKDHIIKDISKNIEFNASILKRENISIESIKSRIEFIVKIVNVLNEQYNAKVIIDLPITEEIYNGSQTVILENDINFEYTIDS